MAALNIRASMINTLDHLFASKKFDVSVSLQGMVPIDRIERAVEATEGAVRSEAWIATEGFVIPAGEAMGSASNSSAAALQGGALSSPAPVGERLTVLGVQPGTKMLQLEIAEGRDLLPDEVDALVVNTALAARNPQIKVGQTMVMRMGPSESSWRVVGIAREAFSPPTGYVSRAYFEGTGGHTGMANSARVALDRSDPASIDRFKEALDGNLEAAGIKALSVTSKKESRYSFDQHMLMIYVFLIVMSAIIGGVGGLGLMTTMSLNVLERRREMGVLRAIGASPRMVWLIVVTEGLVIGFMSYVIAAILSGPLSKGLGDFLSTAMFRSELNFSFDPNGLLIWLAASVALSGAASFLPAWNASRSPVREALGFE
jgi:putative ABC transport system permease protein